MATPSRRTSVLVALAAVATITAPPGAAGQIEPSIGILASGHPVDDGIQIGPTLSVATSLAGLGVPVLIDLGLARTDFTSLGQDYHDDHVFLSGLYEWMAIRRSIDLGLRLGVGAYGEYQTVETDPPTDGGDNWAEMVVAGVVLTRPMTSRTRLTLTLVDFMVGPFDALFDPEEASLGHRVRIAAGVRF